MDRKDKLDYVFGSSKESVFSDIKTFSIDTNKHPNMIWYLILSVMIIFILC
jgi:hypothetical protein